MAAASSSELLLLTESSLLLAPVVTVEEVAGKADEWPLEVDVEGLLCNVICTVTVSYM